MQRRLLREFGKRIRALRTTRGWSQERLAEEAGLHRNYVGGLERGERNVSLVNIGRLASAFGMTPSELLKGIAARQLGDDVR